MMLVAAATGADAKLTGINLAGGEFGGLAGKYGKAYVYPDFGQIKQFTDLGMNVIRVPVRWERIVATPGGPLIEAEMDRIDVVIATAAQRNASVIIDIHNYARFRGQPLGSETVAKADLVDLWSRLATRYKDKPRVIFGLMNEPVRISASDWAKVAQSTVDAIRARGAKNLVLVPGVLWSGAHSWNKRVAGVSNADVLAAVRDPADNVAIDFHQYFDKYSSGASDVCVAPAEAARRLAVASKWLAATGNRGFLSEFAVGRSPECLDVLKTVLGALDADPHWLGWTIWASAQWFGTYHFNLYPATNPPQLPVLKPYLAP